MTCAAKFPALQHSCTSLPATSCDKKPPTNASPAPFVSTSFSFGRVITGTCTTCKCMSRSPIGQHLLNLCSQHCNVFVIDPCTEGQHWYLVLINACCKPLRQEATTEACSGGCPAKSKWLFPKAQLAHRTWSQPLSVSSSNMQIKQIMYTQTHLALRGHY